MLPRNFYRAWQKARKAVGRPDLTLHDLRHTGLTWSAATGAPIRELMRRGGHASPRAAVRYQRAAEESNRALAAALSKNGSRSQLLSYLDLGQKAIPNNA